MTKTKEEKAYEMTDRLFWIFIGKLDPKTISNFIEKDPNNSEGTRNTEKGLETLQKKIETYILNRTWRTNNE
jgi:hypothetical protein